MELTARQVSETNGLLKLQAKRIVKFDHDGRFDDLVQDAWLALLERYPFDPTKGMSWKSFVASRGLWAMQEWCRTSPLVGCSRRDRRIQPTSYSLDTPIVAGSDETFVDRLEASPRVIRDHALRRRVARAILTLTKVERRLLRGMVSGRLIREEAQRSRLSESRISQLRARVRVRFWDALSRQGVDFGDRPALYPCAASGSRLGLLALKRTESAEPCLGCGGATDGPRWCPSCRLRNRLAQQKAS